MVDFQCRIVFTYVRKIYVRILNRGNVWKVARKPKSWTSLNTSFKLSTFYLASILFSRLKFTCVNYACVAKNAIIRVNYFKLKLTEKSLACGKQTPSRSARGCLTVNHYKNKEQRTLNWIYTNYWPMVYSIRKELPYGGFPVSHNFYVRTCVKFTFPF